MTKIISLGTIFSKKLNIVQILKWIKTKINNNLIIIYHQYILKMSKFSKIYQDMGIF